MHIVGFRPFGRLWNFEFHCCASWGPGSHGPLGYMILNGPTIILGAWHLLCSCDDLAIEVLVGVAGDLKTRILVGPTIIFDVVNNLVLLVNFVRAILMRLNLVSKFLLFYDSFWCRQR